MLPLNSIYRIMFNYFAIHYQLNKLLLLTEGNHLDVELQNCIRETLISNVSLDLDAGFLESY
jgi:hypothetical protein